MIGVCCYVDGGVDVGSVIVVVACLVVIVFGVVDTYRNVGVVVVAVMHCVGVGVVITYVDVRAADRVTVDVFCWYACS